MRKVFAGIVVSAILLLSAGCGQGNSSASGFTQEDLSLTVNGKAYSAGVDIEAVIADLGAGYEYAEGMSCDYDGLDKTYAYDMAVFYTNPLSEGDLVNEIYTENTNVTTSKGIAVGSSKEDVLAAYGDGFEDAGDLLIYRLENNRASLCFEIEDNEVWAIYLTTQSV